MKVKIVMILFSLILLIFGSGITYSLFNSRTNMNNNEQNIAKFVFNTERYDELQFPLIDLNPGDNEEYDFSVSNSDSGVLSNVSIGYQMIIKTYHFVPTIVELYKINDEIEELIMTCDETYPRNDENELMCESPIQELGYSNEELDNYKIKINFPSEYNDALYSDLVDYLNIEIKSWQKTEE